MQNLRKVLYTRRTSFTFTWIHQRRQDESQSTWNSPALQCSTTQNIFECNKIASFISPLNFTYFAIRSFFYSFINLFIHFIYSFINSLIWYKIMLHLEFLLYFKIVLFDWYSNSKKTYGIQNEIKMTTI